MPWTIHLLPALGIAGVQYAGVISYRERCDAKADLVERLKGTGIARVVVDYSSARAADENVEELRKFLDDLATTESLRGAKVAYVAAPMEHETASRAMARLVGYRLHSFRERQSAIKWLLSDAEDADAA